ncbi:glutathione metabolism protein [Syntrophotalea acetylenivorans]|uniref:Glutathione metabolism protein n=1 Tax=Syntrophotalea acetylenivorans TaxID=1842532 RepID=A0A1L3GSX7_9BACT|nr:MAPEG family protein [Syntrophotalea acetylenivorans]APG28778.1 glutathione metabolism protein [Syntrophotalea acetylenivorans]
MHVTPFYAALLVLVFLRLSMRTIKLRRQLKIAIGAGGNPTMHRAMRVHGNFAEYVPLSLLLIFLFELQGAHFLLIHLFGACLLLGRLAHAHGVSREKEDYRYRVYGMLMTFTVLAGSAVGVLVLYVVELIG